MHSRNAVGLIACVLVWTDVPLGVVLVEESGMEHAGQLGSSDVGLTQCLQEELKYGSGCASQLQVVFFFGNISA